MSMPMPVRRVMMSTTESETVEDEVVRLRGEVDALRREVQRLLCSTWTFSTNQQQAELPLSVPPRCLMTCLKVMSLEFNSSLMT